MSHRTDDDLDASRYAALSHDCAARGDDRMAVLAVWAADLQVLQALLWESGLEAAPDPQAQLDAVAEALGAALAEHAAPSLEPVTARALVERARASLLGIFDESVHALLSERLVDLDHLDHLDAPGDGDTRPGPAYVGRLAGHDPHRLVADLRATARDCIAVADAMVDDGDLPGAAQQLRQADLAAFEAYLVTAALRVGDVTGATVDLRWELARVAAADAGPGAGAPDGPDPTLRDCLLAAVGPAERAGLRGLLTPSAGRPG